MWQRLQMFTVRIPTIPPRDNLQDFAERLDPEGLAKLVNEAPQDLSRRLSRLHLGKKALASFGI